MSRLKSALCLVCSAALLLCSAGCGNAAVTAKKNTTITVWTYYNGNQLGEANPLTGLLYCADCGEKMYNHRSKGGTENNPYPSVRTAQFPLPSPSSAVGSRPV